MYWKRFLFVGAVLFLSSILSPNLSVLASESTIVLHTLSPKWGDLEGQQLVDYELLQGEDYDAILEKLIDRLLPEDADNIKRLRPHILRDKQGGHFLAIRKQEGYLKGIHSVNKEYLMYLLANKVRFNVAEVRLEDTDTLPEELKQRLKMDITFSDRKKVGLIRLLTDYDENSELLLVDDGRTEAIAFYTWVGSSDHKFNRKNSYTLKNGNTVVSYDHDGSFVVEGYNGGLWLESLLKNNIAVDLERLREFVYRIELLSNNEIMSLIDQVELEKSQQIIEYLIRGRNSLRNNLAKIFSEFPELELGNTVDEVYSNLWPTGATSHEVIDPKDTSRDFSALVERQVEELIMTTPTSSLPISESDYTVEQLLKEYSIEVKSKGLSGKLKNTFRVLIAKKRAFLPDQQLHAGIEFTVYDTFKTIWIEEFYPHFEEHERKGKGRALIEYLFNRYPGYEILSIASTDLKNANEKLAKKIGAIFIRQPLRVKNDRLTLIDAALDEMGGGPLRAQLKNVRAHWYDTNNYFRLPDYPNQFEEMLYRSA